MCSLEENVSKSFKSLQLEIKNLATIEIDFTESSKNLTKGRTDHLTYFSRNVYYYVGERYYLRVKF